MVRAGAMVLMALALAACETVDPATGQTVGDGLCGVARLAFGPWVDTSARAKIAEATIRAVDAGQVVEWRTERSSGRVTPLAESYSDLGRTCRLLRREVTVDGETGSRDVTACHADGDTWVVVGLQPAGEG